MLARAASNAAFQRSTKVDKVRHARNPSTTEQNKQNNLPPEIATHTHQIAHSFEIASRSGVIVCRLLSTFIYVSFHFEILK